MQLIFFLQITLNDTLYLDQVFMLKGIPYANHATITVLSVYTVTNNGFSDVRFLAGQGKHYYMSLHVRK